MNGGAGSSSVSRSLDGDVMNVAEAATFLHVGKNQIYTLAGRNEIPHRRVGRHLRFSRAALVRWLDSCGHQGAKKGQ